MTNGALIAGLITDLGDEEYAVREKAMKSLTALGADAESALLGALQSPSAEVRDRASRLLKVLAVRGRILTPTEVRAVRAVELLERLDTKEARELLAKWAKENAGTVLGTEAKTALTRLTPKK